MKKTKLESGDVRLDIINAKAKGLNMLLPVAEVRYPTFDGSFNPQGKYGNSEKTASHKATLIMQKEGQFASEHQEFLKADKIQNNKLLEQMFELCPSRRDACIEHVRKFANKKGDLTEEQIYQKALDRFKKKATLPIKTNKETKEVTIDVKTRSYRLNKETGTYDFREPTFYDKRKNVIESIPKVISGAIMGIVIQKRPFDIAAGDYGITYTLNANQLILFKNGKVGGDPARWTLYDRTPAFKYANKNERQSLYIRDGTGKFTVETPITSVKYADMTVEDAERMAEKYNSKPKYAITIEEDDNTKGFFDFVEQTFEETKDFMYNHNEILTTAKEAAKEDLDESSEDFLTDHKSMIFDSEAFQSPLKRDKDTNKRSLKVGQFVTDYNGNQVNPILTDISEAETKPDSLAVNRGSKVSFVFDISAYILSGKRAGVKCDLHLKQPIRIAEHGDDGEGEGEELPQYDFSDDEDSDE